MPLRCLPGLGWSRGGEMLRRARTVAPFYRDGRAAPVGNRPVTCAVGRNRLRHDHGNPVIDVQPNPETVVAECIEVRRDVGLAALRCGWRMSARRFTSPTAAKSHTLPFGP